MMRGLVFMQRKPANGFTLIELMVGLGIMAFLLLMAMPSINTYLLDTKIRVTAQSLYDGAQFARSEALRRNGNVSLILTDSNRGWMVSAVGASIADKPAESASKLTVHADVTSMTFNGQGFASAENTIQIVPVNESTCLAVGGAQRCMNVHVSRGGQVRICDPSITTDGDNRKC